MKELVAPRHFAPKLFEPLKRARRTNDFWGIDCVSISENETYDHTFKNLLDYLKIESLAQLVKERKTQGQINHILDLMGGGYFITPENYPYLDSITGVRLSNPEESYKHLIEEDIEFIKQRNEPHPSDTDTLMSYDWALASLQYMQQSPKRSVVYGSVYETKTWSALDQSMADRKIPSFDLAFCRPAGPFYAENIIGEMKLTKRSLMKYAAVFDRVFELALAKISRPGEMFIELPGIISTSWALKWAKKKADLHHLRIVTAPSNRRPNNKYDYNVVYVNLLPDN